MSPLSARVLLLALLLVSALLWVSPVAAAGQFTSAPTVAGAPAEEGSAPTSDHEVTPMLIWASAAIAVAGLLLGILYLLKRKLGGFPEHPAWVAPITIMPSKNFADEGTFGDAPDPHAGGAHH